MIFFFFQFDLACDEWRWFIIGSSLVVGSAISLNICGYISDRWGRRVAISFTSANYAWINIVQYWAGSYTTFVVCGFLGRLFGAGVFLSCNILGELHLIILDCFKHYIWNFGLIFIQFVFFSQPQKLTRCWFQSWEAILK